MEIEKLYQKYLLAGQMVSTDTRSVQKGSLFFALKGDRFNGNEFALEALQKGALFAVVDDDAYVVNSKTIKVDDTLQTLQQLARFHRKKLQTLVIAITGSNGKTTTKELVKSVLQQSFNVQATQGNLNNHIGVPLTLLSIKSNTDIAIVEMGANHIGEIATLCDIALPDYGYITSFGRAHLEGFGSFEAVIQAKSELYNHLKEHQKTIFYNADDAIQKNALLGYDHLFCFGESQSANLILKSSSQGGFIKLVDALQNEYTSHLMGQYNVSNISSAIAMGYYFRMSKQAIQRGISLYVPSNNRSQIIETERNTVFMDAYNANPTSMRAAIDNILSREDKNKVLVLGDMRELGHFSAEEHQSLADFIGQYTWSKVFLVGSEFMGVNTPFYKFQNTADLISCLKENTISDSCILVKGSRAMALEKVLPLL